MRLRFSLRLVLILFTLLAVAFGAGANFYYGVKMEIRRHAVAVDGLRKFNVYAWDHPEYESPKQMSFVKRLARQWIDERAYPVAGSLVIQVQETPRCEEVLETARDLSGVYELTLSTERLTLKMVNLLGERRDLVWLHLKFESIEPTAIGRLARLTSLQHLTIGAPVSQEFIQTIARLPRLRDLTIDVTGLTPTAIASLKTFPDLRQITITGALKQSDVIAALSCNSTLFRLSLAKCKVSQGALAPLAEARGIVAISIWDECDAPVDLLSEVVKTPQLKILALARASDAPKLNLLPLKASHSIQEVYLASLRPTRAEVQVLLSLPQFEKLSLNNAWSEAELIGFLQSDVGLERAHRQPGDRPVFEWEGREFQLLEGALCRTVPEFGPQ